MSEQSIWVLAIFCVYMVCMLIIGGIAARWTRTVADFFLANRKLSGVVAAISSTASSESGWAILGTAGIVYKEGLAAWWFMPGCLAGYLVNWLWVANPLRERTRLSGALTLPDFIEDHFQDRTHVLRNLAVVIIFLSMMAYVAAQMTAVGKAFDAIFKVPYALSIGIGGTIIILYTLLGGFRAVAWTDLAQGLMMVFGLVLVPILALMHVGGLGSMVEQLRAEAPQAITLSGVRAGPALFGFIIGLFGIGLGYPGQPHVVTRYMAARDEQAIRQGRTIAVLWGFLIYSGAILLGLAGRLLIPELADEEHLFPRAALMLLPAALAGLMLSAIMAAIMSTADSQLLVAASALVRDIYQGTLGREVSEKKLVALSRQVVVVLGVCSIMFALTKTRVVFWFVLFAWSGLGASFGPLVLCCLYWKRVTRAGALAGMLAGFATTLVWKLTGLSDAVIYELVPAFVFSALAIFIVSLVTQPEARSSSQNG